MAEVSQNTKYVKLDDGVSFSLVRTNPKLTTNTKLMYNGKKMYMESYASSELMNRSTYKNVSVKPNSTFNKDIANFLLGSGSQAYNVYQNFSDVTISDSFDNQYETMYWCGAEYIDSYFYDEEIGFVAPLYLREKLPNYFVIFRLDTPSNYNFNSSDSTFDFKTDILDKAVLIKTFDLREGSVLGKYIHNYIEQEAFEFDKSMYVNFSTAEVTYYGINKVDGVLEKKVENFENELLKNDNPVLMNDKWFTEGFERNNLIFPYIINIEYLFDDDTFKSGDAEVYDFARYIGVYCNNIEFGEFLDLDELKNPDEFNTSNSDGDFEYIEDNAIYYFEDNKKNLHRYSNTEYGLIIDGKDSELFDVSLIQGFEKERITGYAEPLSIYEGFVNKAQYGFEILKPLEPGDWVGIEYDGHVECYFADNINGNGYFGEKHDMAIGEYSDFRFSVGGKSTVNDIARALANAVNHNMKSLFEAQCSENVITFYAKRDGAEFNGSETGGAKMLMEASLLYNRKISLPITKTVKRVSGYDSPIENISDLDKVIHAAVFDENGDIVGYEKSSFGDYYRDYFGGACVVDIDTNTDTYKNIFKIRAHESVFFNIGRYLKTNNGDGRRICTNMVYINAEGDVESDYRLVIVEDAPSDSDSDLNDTEYDISVSSTYQVEIIDPFKHKHGVLSWFPVKDFDFDMNYSSYGQYGAFVDECNELGKKVSYTDPKNNDGTDASNITKDLISGIKNLAKSPFFDDYGDSLETEYDYYLETYHPDLCLLSKSAPYISKWGYYDEQKDSCENPYRLNVSKVFGVSNLSANTFLRNCDENEYTHSMPYYMTLDTPDYLKQYQYIISDEIYKQHSVHNDEEYGVQFANFSDCVDYWVNMFKNTDEDMFSYFFSGRKYGNRFDRKYSRLLGGDVYHNPSTLFRGVKFEVTDTKKSSSEYNDYKFSFAYIPVMLGVMDFNSTVYFVKNDTFKFIVGIIFVSTMIGTDEHNIFKGNVDYFNKGFVYAACKDIIRKKNTSKKYNLELDYIGEEGDVIKGAVEGVDGEVWRNNYKEDKEFYMWLDHDGKTVVVTTKRESRDFSNIIDIIGEFAVSEISDTGIKDGIRNIVVPEKEYTLLEAQNDDNFKVSLSKYYENFDVTIYEYKAFTYCGSIICKVENSYLEFNELVFIDVCGNNWEYHENSAYGKYGYRVDVSNIHFKSESLQNILINTGNDSVVSIEIYSVNNENVRAEYIHGGNCDITVDTNNGDITISSYKNSYNENVIKTSIESYGYNGESIEDLRMSIIIKEKFDANLDSLSLKNYFSVFNQVSMYNITESINSEYNVRYYSTDEDVNYRIRVIEPDSIEIEDIYEAFPVKVTQNNKNVIGSIEIKEKQDVDKIGIKVINRYSGFYNPIFNDILYYGDYTYTKTIGRLKTSKTFELPYSNTYIEYNYDDGYGEFGVIKNMYYHKTNISQSNKILTLERPVYPAINEYALDYRDYNIFSSSWDEGYFITQNDLDTRSACEGIGSMKDSLCMFGSKYLNLPDDIFIDTFENGKLWGERKVINDRDNTAAEIMYKEVDDRYVKYHLFIEKRLKRYLKESLMEVFSKYINKDFSFGDKGTIEDDVNEYVERNLLRLYKVEKVFMYIKSDRMGINDRMIENEYLEYMDKSNELKIKNGFPVIDVDGKSVLEDSMFIMSKINEFDRFITYNLKPGFKESFGFGVSFKRK
jgi:hypothetical protein